MSHTVTALVPLALAFAISALMTARLAGLRSGSPGLLQRMRDLPNERSLHAAAMPRTGGIAICTALVAALASTWSFGPIVFPASFSGSWDWLWIGAAWLLVGGVSFLDDLGEVKVGYRFAAHLAAAILLTVGGISWSLWQLPGHYWMMPEILSWPLTLGYIVWMVNLYNFMDGMDGFAGGMAVFGFGALAVLGWQSDDLGFALANAVLVAAAGGFLLHNFPPARIFLGDLGAATLGLFAAIATLVGAQRGLFPTWVGWLAFSPFILDATWTLVRRLSRGERVWQAHRSHHYQRLVLAGWSHRKTVLRSYLVMGACAATAVAAPSLSARDQWFLLAGWAAIYFLIGYRVHLVERSAAVARAHGS